VVLAANRDEMLGRAWDMPAAWWPALPGVVAGRDQTGGGTWMGVNGAGVVATVLNRQGTLGPAPGKRSRGELPLLALARDSAAAAATALEALDAGAWRPFNMVLADRQGAIFVRGLGYGHPAAARLAPGLHMVTAHDPDDFESPRVARHLPRFRAAPPPRPGDWSAWVALLADGEGRPGEQLTILPRTGYGTSSASLLALPEAGPPEWLFAAGPAGQAEFRPVALAA
jgi:hypothetical protein